MPREWSRDMRILSTVLLCNWIIGLHCLLIPAPLLCGVRYSTSAGPYPLDVTQEADITEQLRPQ